MNDNMVSRPSHPSQSTLLLKRATDYIEAHLEENLSLDKIAEALNYSKFYLEKIFREETGTTIYKYIQGRRLSLAAQKLVETRKPVVEIALEAHYSSQQAFTLAFRRLYHCTPNVYRKNGVFTPGQPGLFLSASAGNRYTNHGWGGEMAA